MTERFGDITRRFFYNWQQRQLSVLQHQEKNLLIALQPVRSYMIERILNDVMIGAKSTRFHYKELNSICKRSNLLSQYEINTILVGERFNIRYEKDSLIVYWLEEKDIEELK
jgi:hypothetical protein